MLADLAAVASTYCLFSGKFRFLDAVFVVVTEHKPVSLTSKISRLMVNVFWFYQCGSDADQYLNGSLLDEYLSHYLSFFFVVMEHTSV